MARVYTPAQFVRTLGGKAVKRAGLKDSEETKLHARKRGTRRRRAHQKSTRGVHAPLRCFVADRLVARLVQPRGRCDGLDKWLRDHALPFVQSQIPPSLRVCL